MHTYITNPFFLFVFSEFCGEQNHDLGISPDEVPPASQAVCDYLLESGKVEEKETGEGGAAEKNPNNEKEQVSERSSLVIFAVDISGSMSSTTTVPDLQGMFVCFSFVFVLF